MSPVVTVIVPTYRRPTLLRRVLRSITSQAHEGFGIVARVYDNASGDETEAVVRAAGTTDVPVEYVGRPANVGIIRNMYVTRAGNLLIHQSSSNRFGVVEIQKPLSQ